MITLWTIAGAIIGWLLIELVAVVSDREMPILFNVALAFVGALTAYTILTN